MNKATGRNAAARIISQLQIGAIFDYWTVIGDSYVEKDTKGIGRRKVPCKCKCGRENLILSTNLIHGHTASCGCKGKESPPRVIGSVHGKWTIISGPHRRRLPSGGLITEWLCRCACGEEEVNRDDYLKRISKSSSRCFRHLINKMGENLIGQIFGRLTVVRGPIRSRYGFLWKCKCECGTIKNISASALKSGGAKSCRCLQKELVSKRFSLPGDQASYNYSYNMYKRAASDRKILFNIDKESFQEIIRLPCHYCGFIPNSFIPYTLNGKIKRFNGIDRMDNSVGYIASNCVPCCTDCNRAKLQKPYQEYISWIKRSHDHLFPEMTTISCPTINLSNDTE